MTVVATANGTATAPGDYVAITSQTVTSPPAPPTLNVTVTTTG